MIVLGIGRSGAWTRQACMWEILEKKEWSATSTMKAHLVDLTPSWGSKGGEMSPTKGGVVRLDGGVRGSVKGEEDVFEAHEGRWLRGVDSGEVETGEEGDEGEDF